ncbi:MAG: ATP-binding protein, partial [Alphaproteobacteria bacterium]
MNFNRKTLRIAAPVLVVLITVAAVLSSLHLGKIYRDDLGRNLTTVLEASRASVRLWAETHKTSVDLWADNVELIRAAQNLLAGGDFPDVLIAAPAQKVLRNLLTPAFKGHGVKGFFIIGPNNINLASSRDENLGYTNVMGFLDGVLDRAWAGETLVSPPQKASVELRDTFGDLVYGLATMFAVAPVRDNEGAIIALLALRLEPDEGISRYLEAGYIGSSGETYAINSAGVLISESRFNKQLFELGLIPTVRHSDLNIRVANPGVDLSQGGKPKGDQKNWPLTRMAKDASAGWSGLDLEGYRDYRGVFVVGAWVWDDDLKFAMATEIDVGEAYGQLNQTRIVIALFAAFSSALLIVLVVVFERGRARLTENIRELDFQKFAADEHAIISSTDVSGNIIEVNDKFVAISGYERSELIGRNHRMLKSEEHSSEYYKDLWDTLKDGNVWHGDIKNKHKDGSHYWVKATIVPLLNEKGEPFRYLSIRTDITARTEAATKLHESKALLNLAIENISDGFALFDADDRLVLSNRKFRNIHPFSRDVIQPGTRFEDIIRAGAERGGYPDAEGRIEEWIAGRMASRKNAKELFEYENNAGKWIRVSEQALPDGGRVGLRADVTELKEATAMADEANKAKSEFLSSMSHELRTPLNAILGFGQMLEFNPKEPLTEAQKSCTDHIMKGGRHLLDLINEVLDLAKIEAGHMDISIDNIKVREIVEECLSLIVSMADARAITINVAPGAQGWPSVRADYTRFKQVLLNLMSNAVKYNTEGGTIDIDCRNVEPNMLRISVTDSGVGIPREKQSELFQPFSRLGAESTETEGTGIGLTITKKLIEMMDGHIGCDSVEGEGSTFWIEIPLSAKQKAEDGHAETPGAIVKNLQKVAGTILYVEDNPANMALMKLIIERTPGLKMETAHTAEIGLELARTHLPDVILLD